ncbi:hypothetical protein B0H63DRAFT_219750 [Podospora didyma]|uniref:Uncharacterized protein n=1 Tax=Podospora didyma TaxID=330526 RepID=A0AAE0NCD4_9PEZI|nr:hypothetical protein B0H63DRAFT_219750 [Podospora didyma]
MHASIISIVLVAFLTHEVSAAPTTRTCTAKNATPISALTGSNGIDLNPDIDSLIKRSFTSSSSLQKRADSVECYVDEYCAETKGLPFCYETISGRMRDTEGTVGNLITGDYTLADGRKGNMYKGPHPQPGDGGASGETATKTTSTGKSKATGASGSSGTTGTSGANAAGITDAPTGTAAADEADGTAPATSSKNAGMPVYGGASGAAVGGMIALLGVGLL